MLEKLFHLKENKTTVSREVIAGCVTFFAMSYIIFVAPSMLEKTGMPFQAVFLATIIASAVGTGIMALFANVPYAQAPGMGLTAFFAYTVCASLGYTWQQALSMVFICGLINILITVTRVRKMIIEAIPEVIQHAIGAGIGAFICYIGIKNAGFLTFTSDKASIISSTVDSGQATSVVSNGGVTPALAIFNNPAVILALIGLVLTIVLVLCQVKSAILIGIVATTILAIPMGVVDLSQIDWQSQSLTAAFGELKTTMGAIFTSEGLPSLFSDTSKIPQVLMTILAFSLSDIFDTIGTFIGADRKAGIFSAEEIAGGTQSKGLKTKMDRALFSDAIATTTGSLFGASNVTTYVESTAGIASGGRTGLTALVVAGLFLLSAVLSPVVGLVPTQATAPVLIIVGIMMMGSFVDIHWDDLEEAVPAFFTSVFMAFCYSISYGIAAGFIFYCLTKVVKGKAREVKPILWIVTALFVLNFIVQVML